MPALLQDCDIPLFLRDKKYADFRTDFDAGLSDLLKAIARVTNDIRSRLYEPEWHTDWAIDWGMESTRAAFRLTFVEQAVDKPFSCLAMFHVRGNAEATERYLVYLHEGLDWVYSHVVMETLAQTARDIDLRVVLHDPPPQVRNFTIRDERLGIEWKAELECRLLGEDSGFDVLLDLVGLLDGTVAHARAISRKPTEDELVRMYRVLATLNRK